MAPSLHTACGILVLAAAGLATAAEAQNALSSSIAHYEVTHDGRTERLDVMRTSERIEHRYLTREISEVWTRDPRGELSHWKVFHRAQRAVHYTAGDLRTIEAEPAWEELATLFKPSARSKMKTTGTKRRSQGLATVLEGTVDHMPARIIWNEHTGWAEEVSIGAGVKRRKFRLLSIDGCSPATCVPFDTGSVREVEFADLGDMERDPFVRNFLAAFASHRHR